MGKELDTTVIEPTEQQLLALVGDDRDTPVGMLNLLKFREVATYDDPNEPQRSGAEAYMLYGAAAQKRLEELGGGILFMSGADRTIVGGRLDEWDMVAIATYPRARDFPKLIESEEYVEALKHRTAGLLRTQVIQLPIDETLIEMSKAQAG